MLNAAKDLLSPSRRSDVPPFIVMDVMAAAAAREARGERVVHMEVGQPAAPAPLTARRAAAAALETGRIGYTESLGLPSLRARIARHYRDTYGLDLDPARVAVTTGSSGAFILSFLSLFEPGDRVALANPGYPPYRHILTALGCEPVLIETSAASRWVLSPDALIAAHRKTPLKGVIVASPANPTGTMMSAAALAELIAVAEDAGLRVISDEIYHGLDYAFAAETAAKLSPRALVINSFSKYFCMTGWHSAGRPAGCCPAPAGWSCRSRWCARSTACTAISPSRCRPWRRSRPKPPSTGARRWRRSSTAMRRTAAY